MPLGSARATGPAFESFFSLSLFCRQSKLKLGENHLKVDFRKICTEKSEKTVFLGIFDIWADMTLKGRFLAENQIFVVFKLNVG